MLFGSMRSGGIIRSAARNFHSTSPHLDTASSAKNAASGASKQLTNLAERAKALGKPIAEQVSSRTGVNLSSLTDSLTYNLRVAGSLFKQVYIAEGLAPPKSFNVIREAYQTLYTRAIDPNYWTKMVNNGEWKKFGIYAVEAYGIFTIGEMIGRRHLVGYKIDKSAHPSHGDDHHM